MNHIDFGGYSPTCFQTRTKCSKKKLTITERYRLMWASSYIKPPPSCCPLLYLCLYYLIVYYTTKLLPFTLLMFILSDCVHVGVVKYQPWAGGRHGCDGMEVGFTTTYAIRGNHQKRGFESHSLRGVLNTTLCD
jgi:hypothetical protein